LPTPIPDNPATFALAEESKTKPALVLIHGYAASVEHWRHTFNGLKGRYRIYALDLLGFGLSDKPDSDKVDYSADLWVKQVYDFLKYKKEEKAVICGHSLGGMVALRFCQLHPEMVAGLILIDTAGLPDQGHHHGFSFGELAYTMIKAPLVGETMAALLTSGNRAIKRGLLQSYYNPAKVTSRLVEQFRAPLQTPGARASYLAVTRNFARYRLSLQPGDIKAKTLIIWGQHDKGMPPAEMLPRWQQLIPQAQTYIAGKAGHCPHDERPDLVVPQIMRFMETQAAISSSD
jgi:pimeloyl-ACP methyl ester carboxylesterase